MSKTTNWDAVIASAPLNKDAAVARDGKGTHWTPEMKLSRGKVRHFAPIPTKPLKMMYMATNLTGLRVGKLTVVGLADFPERNKKRPAAWVVRCVCGYYETRTAKALRNPAFVATNHECDECRYLTELKAGRVKRPTVAERTKVSA